MTEVHESWGRRIHDRRRAIGLSQEALAEICGIEQSTISRIESGKLCPRDALKWTLAGALGQTVEQLFPYPAVKPPFPVAEAS